MLKSKFLLMRFVAVLGSTLIGLMFAISASAAVPEPVVVQVAFVAPIAITETNQLEFGSLDVAMAFNDTVTINLDNSFSEVPVGGVVGGTQASAKLDIDATGGRPIKVSVSAFTNGADYTLGTWVCDYNGLSSGDCIAGISVISFGPGTAEVRVGVTLTAAGGATAGDDPGSFDLLVAYE